MLRRIIIIAIAISIPAAFYVALQYGQLKEVSFKDAVRETQTEVEGDQAPKVIVVSTILNVSESELLCADEQKQQFRVNYSGSEAAGMFTVGATVRFVGHVHGGSTPYFHATQVYSQ